METARILELFDDQLRRAVVDEDGILVLDGWSGALWPPPDGDVERVVSRLLELPGHVEWKLYGHDPPELAGRLRAAGLEPEEQEAVLVAEIDALSEAGDVDVRVAGDAAGVAAFAEVEQRAFGERQRGIERELLRALQQDLPSTVAVVAFADGEPVSTGRIDFTTGGTFAGLFGGGTAPEFRGRGFYRATVAKRAELARERGYRYLYVDALPTSRPILQRLGFVQVTTTTPYTPPKR